MERRLEKSIIEASPARSQQAHAYHALRRLLILQQLPANQRLREPEWAAELGVHRGALREAFARLEAEGLLERGPKTGYFVPLLAERDMQIITKLRLALECLAIEELCASPAAIKLKPLGDACNEFDRFVEGGYALGAIEADRRFHEAIIDAAGIRRLTALYHHAPLPLITRKIQSDAEWAETGKRTSEEHRKILQAIQNRDAKAACHRLAEHVTRHR
jgi:DNA-binding GntR family transcriptional regulator